MTTVLQHGRHYYINYETGFFYLNIENDIPIDNGNNCLNNKKAMKTKHI